MPAPTKSRAAEQARRRKVKREMRKIREEMQLLRADESSDEDFGTHPPPPPPVRVMPRPDSPSSSDEGAGEAELVADPIQRANASPPRVLVGRRLLYGPAVAPIMSDDTSANDESFSDNAPEDLNSDGESTDPANDYGFQVRPISSSESSHPNSDSELGDDGEITVREEVAAYVCKHNFSVTCTNELLKIFASAGVQGLPKDKRALVKTNRSIVGIVEKCGGLFKYLGLERGLIHCLENNPTFVPPDNTISFNVNVDGVPLYKSTNGQFWPLLCGVGKLRPFVVALYYGEKKPDNIGDYLEEFLEEYEQLSQQGLGIGGTRYNVSIRCWICDAPARALLKCIKGHTGYYGCERCKAKGVYVANKVTYEPNIVHGARTDAEFARRLYYNPPNGDTHQKQHPSPLVGAQLNCVSGFVLDIMHNVHLGSWKRMLQFLKSGPRALCRLSMNQLVRMNGKLMRIRLPREFCRQPRSIFDLDRWKATELRSSLLYSGYIFLKGVVSNEMYKLYLKLSVAMNILHTENSARRNLLLNFARELILEFIRDSHQLLGEGFVVYNVHSMSHVPDDVERFNSSVNAISAFPFENHLQSIKKMVKGPCNPLAQVCGRLGENARHDVYRRSKETRTYISASAKDSMFYLSNTREFAMVQRQRRRDKRYDVIVFSVDDTQDFFVRPCPSKLVNVFLARNLDNMQGRGRILSKAQLHHKVVLIPCDNGRDYLLIPMLHDAEVDHV